ncbi:MAG: hypothetical protein JO057_05245, partial [Chloroflexi bacterium]|nr:hypothetical protein [Chloroflexota bacterium]
MSRLRRGSSTPAALEIVEDQRAGLFIETSSGNKIQSVEGIMPRHAQPPTEQPAADWERPFGAFLLMLGVSALVFAVIPRAWSNGALLNQLNLVRWPLLVPVGLLAASLAVTGLWLGSNHRVRRLANSAAGIPGRVGTTRAGPVLLVVLGLSVALGAATWDLLLDARAPWAAPLVLAMSLLGSWFLALGALALNRTGEVSTTRGTYLLVVMTFAILVLGEWSHRDTLQQLPCGAGAGVPLHEVIGPGSRRICSNAR